MLCLLREAGKKKKRWWTPSEMIREDGHIHASSVTWGQQVQKYHSDCLDLHLFLLDGPKNFSISRKALGCSLWRTINGTVSKRQSSSISDKRGTTTKSLGEAARGYLCEMEHLFNLYRNRKEIVWRAGWCNMLCAEMHMWNASILWWITEAPVMPYRYEVCPSWNSYWIHRNAKKQNR